MNKVKIELSLTQVSRVVGCVNNMIATLSNRVYKVDPKAKKEDLDMLEGAIEYKKLEDKALKKELEDIIKVMADGVRKHHENMV